MVKKAKGKGKSSAREVKKGTGRSAGRPRRERRPIDRRVLLVLAVILLVGVGLRGLYLRELTNTPDFEYPLVDSDYHDYWARGMAFGSWPAPRFEPDPRLQDYPYFRPPGYPFFLAAVYKLTGRGYVAPRVVQMLVGVVNALLAFMLARRLFGSVVGLIAAGLMSAYWVFIYFEGEFLEPSFAVLLILAAVHVLSTWTADESPRRSLVAGVLIGILALVRPNALVWVPAVGFWMLWVLSRRGERGRAAVAVAALVVGVVLAVVPVTIRNATVGRDFVPISSNGGVNLFIGNNDRADGLVRGTMPGIGTLDTSFDWPTIVSNVERKTGRRMKHSEVSDYLAGEATAWMRAHPGKVVNLMWKKTLFFWGPTEPADNKVVAGDRAHSGVLRSIPLNFSLVLALALAGAVLFCLEGRAAGARGGEAEARTRERWETMVLVMCLAVLWYASHLPFAVTARYRAPIIPFLILLGAFYAERMWRFITGRDWKRTAIWAAALAGVLVLTGTDFAPNDEPSMARWHYQRGIAFTRAGQIDEAISEYGKALEINPRYTAVYNDMAAALAGRGMIAESIPYFRKALEGRPNDATLRFNLALALELVGALEESRVHYSEAVRLRPGDSEARGGLERVEQALADRPATGR